MRDFGLAYVRFGSWPCENALGVGRNVDLVASASGGLRFFGSDYALIAAMSGWMPMMFITRVRL